MVSIIVLEYNSVDEIDQILVNLHNSLEQERYELIISSNSLYSLKKREKLKSVYSDAKWVFNRRNGGFAYGMNEGLKVANGDILVVMNSDVCLCNSLNPMVDYLESHQKVGIIAPKIVDDNNIIQDSFRNFVTPFNFFMRQLGRIINNGELHVKDLKKPVSVDWVIGAFMMCSRAFYEKVGGLCDDYFMYCEDMDWCKRAHHAGYDVIYYPDVVVNYKGTRAARSSWKYFKIFIKSLLTYWKKYGIV